MKKNKNLSSSRVGGKKLRFVAGSALFCVFMFKFLIIGLGSLTASFYSFISPARAEVFQKTIPSDFRYQTDNLKNLRAINLKSFVGKPVKLPFYSTNPEGMPGADLDYLILFPPQFLNNKTTIPMRALYFSSGPSMDQESVQFAQKSQEFVNSIAENNATLLEILKNLLESNLKMSVSDDSCRDALQCVSTLFALLPGTARAADDALDEAGVNALLASDEITNLPTDLDTSDPQVKQLLTIILLLLITNQALAESANAPKQECLDSGGEWINNECASEDIAACEDNGGMWKKMTNQCFADKESCGNEDLECLKDDGEEEGVFGCVCKAGSCLDDNGICVEEDNGKKAICEDGGGTWREFFSAEELCLQKCGATESACSSAFSSGGSALRGCDCGSADDGSDKWTTGNTATGKCLAPTGKCIAKDTSGGDDDNDGVPNGQDRCAGSAPDGSGTANKNLGGADAGCTCSQLLAMGRIQQPRSQQQCPPDGCEDRYMVRYDRSQQNTNPAALCQNGIIQQQQQQQQNATCTVLSRTPTQECEEEMERKKNQNKNDNLKDMLEKLLKDKEDKDKKDKDKDKDKGQQQQQQGSSSSSGGGGNPGGNQGGDKQPPGQQPPGQQTGQTTPANDPKGVGDYNAKQDGSPTRPYALHVSQFKKVCGENTYVLVTSQPGEGKFKNESKQDAGKTKPGTLPSPASKVDNLKCPGGKCDRNNIDIRNRLKKLINDNWAKLDEQSQTRITKAIENGPSLDQQKINIIQDLISKAPKTDPAQTPGGGPAADTMQDLKTKEGKPRGDSIHFKVPKCEELAACHCCVCSCCDKNKKDCGWNIAKNCKDGACEGQKCDAESCNKCQPEEDPEKTIQLTMGATFPAKITNKPDKQADNLCYQLDHEKEKTAKALCENFEDAVHTGICRYDCKGETKGCEEERKDCKIIINVGDDPNGSDDLQFKRKEKPNEFARPAPKAKRVEFTNEDGGSVIVATKGVDSSWVKKLGKEKGKCCKCDEKDKLSEENQDPVPADGIASPSSIQPEQPQEPEQTEQPQKQPQPDPRDSSYTGDRAEDWDWLKGKPPAQPPQPPQPQQPSAAAPTGQISQDKINGLRDNAAGFKDYIDDRFRSYPPTWEDWRDYQGYQKWQDSLPTISRWFNKLIGGNTFEYYKKNIKR